MPSLPEPIRLSMISSSSVISVQRSSISSVTPTLKPYFSYTLAASIIVVSEVSPSDTRLSLTLEHSKPVISPTIAHSAFSIELSCLAPALSLLWTVGFGSLFLSTLPFGVIGMRSICIVTDGTI